MGNSLNNIADDFFDKHQTESLCCYITKDFTFTGDVQQEFKKRYGSTYWLKNQNKNLGDIIPVFDGNRYIYYLIVKESNYRQTIVSDLNAALNNMIIHAQNNGISQIGLQSKIYSEINSETLINSINTSFNGTGLQYTIYEIKLNTIVHSTII